MGEIENFKKQGTRIFKVGITDDSSIHLLNRLYCVVFLIILAMLVSSKQYVGNPIQCWCPAMFTGAHVKYTNNYCWVSNTYYVDFESSLPLEKEIRVNKEIEYYQWVPLILVFQALLFYLPRMFWKRFGGYTLLNIKKMLNMAASAGYLTGEERDKALDDIVAYLHKYIKIRNTISSPHHKMEIAKEKMSRLGLHYGNYLVFLFMVTSFLYIMTAAVQIIVVDIFLGNDFKNLGFEFLSMIFKGQKFEDYGRFPRVTFCDLDVRQMTNVQTWTVQCSLPINLFNEKLFFCNWLMLVSMVIINSVNFLYNLISIFLPYRTDNYVTKFMEMEGVRAGRINEKQSPRYGEVKKEFVREYLRHDGVFLIWFLSNKTNQVIASEIVSKLWQRYTKEGLVEAKLHADDDEYLSPTAASNA
ncbi:innexin unc-9-like [Mytilus trossulus]|uniref:innexin unc-9-like n=1 Tax=Mytilus trossulus TaxID=6551 RepID=UPI003006DE08